ncbi:MAG: alpha-galactosidase [Anaerolineales bacterium]|nr:alpha-galactosidase [Anaerolineales bacterium]
MTAYWVDAHLAEGDAPRLSYRSGLTVYAEALVGGQYVGCGWNAAGALSELPPYVSPPHATPQAFWLEVDGQFLGSHWEWVGFDRQPHAVGLQTRVRLRHSVRPISVEVHTLLDGTPVLTRWLTITNTGDRPAALGAVAPWSGVLQSVRRWADHLPKPDAPLYSVGYFGGDRWSDEGDFHWRPLPNASLRIDGRYRRDRFRHPLFMLRNQATGEHFIGQLGWSGGYTFEFDLDQDPGLHDGVARLFFRAGPDAPAPQRVLAPGETVATPALHLGLLPGDLDDCINAMHTHVRRSVLRPQARGRGGWVESGIGPELEITGERVQAQIDRAAAIGAEVFFIDASWYAPPGGNWYTTVGDWQVDRQRFPNGLAPFRERAHAHGLLWGLWMDAERLGVQSQMAKVHPEWLAVNYSGERRLGDMLDLTNPAAMQWMEDVIAGVISEHQLELFRLDMNVGRIGPAAATLRAGYVENSYWRYYEALYAVYDRLRARFPAVIFEHCASGGGRTDLGMIARFAHTWVTDWPIAPRAFRITNGMTMALPPEYVDRLWGGQNSHTAGDLDFQLRLLLFARPTLGFFHPDGAVLNPLLLARLREFVAFYKDFVRPFAAESRIFHHTPEFTGLEPQGWGVLELAAGDGRRAIAGLFQLASPPADDYVFRPRGLDRSRRYRLTLGNEQQTVELDGAELAETGLTVRLEGALTSQLLSFEAL